MGSAVMRVTELRRHLCSVVLQQVGCNLFCVLQGSVFFFFVIFSMTVEIEKVLRGLLMVIIHPYSAAMMSVNEDKACQS